MNKVTKSLFLLAMSLLLSSTAVEAQFLKDIARSAKNKLVKKVERKVVETLAEEIARKAFRPINDVMDDWIRENMKRDSTYAGISDDSLAIVMRENYSTILGSLNKAADLPASYSFDYTMDVQVTDDNDVHDMKWFIDMEGDAMAFEQMDGGNKQIMLMDIKNDIIVMYDPAKKTGQALPGMMSLGAAFAQQAMEKEGYDALNAMKKGGSKKVAGYNCNEFSYESEEYESEVWVSNEVPFNYKEAFGTLIGRVSPKLVHQNNEIMDGMMLESTTKEKGKRKGKYKSVSKWVTKSITKDNFTIENGGYTFGMDME